MNEQVADVKSTGALTGTDAVDLRQDVARAADRARVGRQAPAHPHPSVPASIHHHHHHRHTSPSQGENVTSDGWQVTLYVILYGM